MFTYYFTVFSQKVDMGSGFLGTETETDTPIIDNHYVKRLFQFSV
jgi:hypothetical protein